MVIPKIEDTITFEIDITEMLEVAQMVTIRVIHNNKVINVDSYRRRNKNVKKRRIVEN